MIMKILILGISGRTGRLVAEEAIRRGHKVIGISRDPDKVILKDALIIKGTPYNIETVRMAIDGCDAVISTLNLFYESQGLFKKIKTPLDLMSVSIKNTITAMEEKGIRRIILMTAIGVGNTANKLPVYFSLLKGISNLRFIYADHERQEHILESSALDWTIVRPVGLHDKNDNLSVLSDIDGSSKLKSMISRNAVAHFILCSIENRQFIRQKPAISNR
jgi:putative NADH-flavin reductase